MKVRHIDSKLVVGVVQPRFDMLCRWYVTDCIIWLLSTIKFELPQTALKVEELADIYETFVKSYEAEFRCMLDVEQKRQCAANDF